MNAAALARNFLAAGFDVAMSDVVDGGTLDLYCDELPDVLVVRLSLLLNEAQRRASLRPRYITDNEFTALHAAQTLPLAVDYDLDVTAMTVEEQVAAVRTIWTS